MQLLEDLRGTAMMQQLRHKVGRGPKGLKNRPKVNFAKGRKTEKTTLKTTFFFVGVHHFFHHFLVFFLVVFSHLVPR